MATCEWTRAIVRARAARAERRADDARGGFRAQKVPSRARAGAGKRRARANAAVRASENDESGAASNASVRESEPYGENAAKNAAYKASMSDAQLELHRASGRDVTYALKISYDGERYNGFQYQGEDVPTIQRELERALAKLTGIDRERLRLGAAGRTDAGVHARGQVAHFYCEKSLGEDLTRCQKAMNGMLPKDIRVDAFWEPHPLFHSRFHASGKTYHYYVDARATSSPFTRKYAHQVGWRPCDVELLRQAAQLFVGTMDYKGFCNTSRDKSNEDRNTTRTIRRFDVFEDAADDGLIRLEVEGDGFLYRQVRNMVGALLVVASGKHDLEYLRTLIETKDRSRAPMGAPARGLFLHEVFYPTEVLARPRSDDIA